MRIRAEAPCRLSLFGGSTDIPPYSTKHGGICINAAINIKQRVVLNDENRWNLQSYDNKDFFKFILDDMLPGNNFGVEHEFDGVIGSGIASSAALAVALVGAVNYYSKLGMSKSDVAERARDLESNKVDLFTGRQDQYSAAYGGVNFMVFGEDTVVFPLDKQFLAPIFPYLQMFYLGFNRQAAKILSEYKSLTPEKVLVMNRIKALAYNSLDHLRNGDIEGVATLLREAWEMKKASNTGVANKLIDGAYEAAIANGALAGKVMGAGGGGHMLFLVPPEKQDTFKAHMEDLGLTWVDFSIDWQGLDCRCL